MILKIIKSVNSNARNTNINPDLFLIYEFKFTLQINFQSIKK
jgi:hypothetical protein